MFDSKFKWCHTKSSNLNCRKIERKLSYVHIEVALNELLKTLTSDAAWSVKKSIDDEFSARFKCLSKLVSSAKSVTNS